MNAHSSRYSKDVTLPDSARPRRLLHVPTMTSVTWDEAVRQSGGIPPPYNILSYTWGRFVDTNDGPALGVQNIYWKVPVIQPAHFTIAEFELVLRTIAHQVSGYVWVDVACIDQENVPIKMDEIGKQADIFRGADHAFIWLTQLDGGILKKALRTLSLLDDQLVATDFDVSRFVRDHQELDLLLKTKVEETISAVSEMLSDPWFTSLWALQEANLREDAFILPRTAERLHDVVDSGQTRQPPPMLLSNFSGVFQDLHVVLAGFAASTIAQDSAPRVGHLISLMERSGLLTINFGMDIPVQLYPAAHFRTCGEQLDRVYAIMQVYGLRLGAAREPSKTFTLEELEDELAEALNARSPMAAQLFVHRDVPKPGKAWRITANCMLPSIYSIAHSVYKECKILASPTALSSTLMAGHVPRFEGLHITLPSLIQFWTESMHQRERQRLDWWHSKPEHFHHYQVNIDLDAGHIAGDAEANLDFWRMASEPSKLCGCEWCVRQCTSTTLSDAPLGFEKLALSLPLPTDQYRVLLVGRTMLYNLMGPRTGHAVAACLGLVGTVERPSTRESSRSTFRRIGLCSWEAAQAELKQQHEEIWLKDQFDLL